MGNFYADVISHDARFDSLARVNDPAFLEPVTRQRVAQLISAAAATGVRLMIYETYRSQKRQQALFESGATKLRTVGVHHYGLACDIVRDIGGEPSWKGDFAFLGELAHASGLIWGGDWGNPNIKHSFVDAVHVQRCTIARQPALFAGTWYPDDAYNPYTDDPQVVSTAARPVQPSRSKRGATASRARKKS